MGLYKNPVINLLIRSRVIVFFLDYRFTGFGGRAYNFKLGLSFYRVWWKSLQLQIGARHPVPNKPS